MLSQRMGELVCFNSTKTVGRILEPPSLGTAGGSAKDPDTAATVALALLTRNLGYNGVQNPTADAVKEAIDKFGEHDGRYGQAVVDCAAKLKSGDFSGAMGTLQGYATWVAKGRP